jgi:hypothetical protein
MSRADVRKKLNILAKESAASGPDPEEIARKMRRRIFMLITDELGVVQAPQFILKVVNGGPSLAEEAHGPAYTVGQYHELAIRRPMDRLDEGLGPTFNTTDDTRRARRKSGSRT